MAERGIGLIILELPQNQPEKSQNLQAALPANPNHLQIHIFQRDTGLQMYTRG
jgi:hypothetical protein